MASQRLIVFVFAATMALAGFLLFQVQPLLAKFILPWFGGSASTWIVCLAFFQLALLVGYAHAYLVTLPLTVPRQVQVQLALLVASLLLLPITPADGWKPQAQGDPTWRILALLTVSVGLPYVMLATTTPLLSRWLARIVPEVDPAPLFAASNAGSFAGLLSYPFIVERLLPSLQQTQWWSWAFLVFAALFALCACMSVMLARDSVGTARPVAAGTDPLLAWIGFAALGSVLLLSTTNAITQWSAVVPFLWIIPLGLYLLSFVIVFADPRLYDRTLFGGAFLLLAGMVFFQSDPTSSGGFATQLAQHAAALFTGCMVCHGELARRRPQPVRLPKFYLAIAVGGAAGGCLVTLLAPLIFSDYFEHPLALAAVAVAAFALILDESRARAAHWMAYAGYGTGVVFLGFLGWNLWNEFSADRALVERVRNFYGVVRVLREDQEEPERATLIMQQAGVDQGVQYQAPARKMELVCGFNASSGLGLALAHQGKRRAAAGSALRIGVIGLGAGMVAGLGREGDLIRYYELNPAVLDLANRHFTFLRDGKAKSVIDLGDARLTLERQLQSNDPQQFDVLVLNAFRGASPPMHLMTREAFDIYQRHLAENGILAVNFEVEMFETGPLHRGLAKEVGMLVRWFETKEGEDCEGPISWAIYSKDRAFFEVPAVKAAASKWRDGSRSELVWTDSDSSLMSIIRWSWE
jgi:hypothetical protein